LRSRTSEKEVKEYAIEIMEKSGSFAYTAQFLRRTEQQVREEIQRLGGNAKLERIIDQLSEDYLK
jgi:geranylgeranyl diphosphate synthase type 3